MQALTTDLLGQACRIFLGLTYPNGGIPASKKLFYDIEPNQALEPLLAPPICQTWTGPEGAARKYAFRLGSRTFPHMKLQVADAGDGRLIFGVDTHDAMKLDPDHPDVPAWKNLQAANRALKEKIEHAWEAAGLMTFNSLLRDGIAKMEPESRP